MTIKFLADENFDHKTLAGLKRREPGLDKVAVQEVGIREVDDPQIRKPPLMLSEAACPQDVHKPRLETGRWRRVSAALRGAVRAPDCPR